MAVYLVLARTAPSDNPNGDMSIYAANFATEREAADGVEADLPAGWSVERVIGPATEGLQRQMQLKPNAVERLGG